MASSVVEINEPGTIIAALHEFETEEVLVAAAKRGDAHAFEILVKRHESRILALALRYTHVREDAEDVVQQTFQKAFRYLHRFEGKSSFSTWLTRIAINEALMSLRRTRGQREISINDSNNEEGTTSYLELADGSPDPEARYLQLETAQMLMAVIRDLSPQTRTVIELCELRELGTRETACRLGLSLAAVKARVLHGRRKLREKLQHRMNSHRTPRNAMTWTHKILDVNTRQERPQMKMPVQPNGGFQPKPNTAAA
jgi:RNA polymerase sigma-70 factor (ECF subfamily)